ncbi:MAG: hypothetical protein U0414_29730 [Polyangiaceae bacterium]
MFADPKKNDARRLRRRLKAGASIVMALCAGAFLAACGADAASPPSPSGPDARGGPPRGSNKPSSTPAGSGSAAPSAPPAPSPAQPTSSVVPSASSSAIVPAAPSSGPAVDKNQHKKGMPVPDNLLE